MNEEGMLPYLRILYRRKLMIIGMAAAAGLIAGGVSLFLPVSYTTTATLYPAKQAAPQGIGNLLNLGEKLGLGGAQAKDPIDILADIVKTNTFLKMIAGKPYRSERLGRQAGLMEIYHIKGETQALKDYYLIESLKKKIEFSTDKHSGVLYIEVTTPEPQLCKDLADTLIADLNAYYRKLVSSKKSSYRDFLGNRVDEAGAALKESEERLRTFKERNLLSTNSPEIFLLQARYQRDMRINEELFLTLRKEYEMAKLDEHKDMPAVDVLDAPEVPIFKTAPMKRKIVTFFTFVGLLAGAALAIALEKRSALAAFYGDISRPRRA
jgi:uncharacterized protein involved in exopolysaccharide biosynthesis